MLLQRVRLGHEAFAGDVVIELIEAGQLPFVRAQVPHAQAVGLRVGDRAIVQLIDGQKIEGAVTDIRADLPRGEATVRINLSQPLEQAQIGTIVQAWISPSGTSGLLSLLLRRDGADNDSGESP